MTEEPAQVLAGPSNEDWLGRVEGQLAALNSTVAAMFEELTDLKEELQSVKYLIENGRVQNFHYIFICVLQYYI